LKDLGRPDELDQLVDHLFRRESGRLVARLVNVLGPRHIDLAEEAVQEAMVQALRSWPFGGVPDHPVAWLSRVARNRALDVLRRRSNFDSKRDEVVSLIEARLQRLPEPTFAAELDDDQLRLIFTCCHPALPGDSRIALTLKTVCGFSVAEIARSFLVKEATIAQRLVRAKRRIAELELPYAVPPPAELPQRLDSVLKVVYLFFNEGYSPAEHEQSIRIDVCEEAVRLASTLADHSTTGFGQTHALAALLLLQGARLSARRDEQGELLLLEEQDRSLWRRDWLSRGLAHLAAAMKADTLSPYHLEAGIAACHATAATWEATDWEAILGYYDQLLALQPSAVTALNRAIALAMLEGAASGLGALDEIEKGGELDRYYLLAATRGELLRRTGDRAGARAELLRAHDLAPSPPVRRLLHRRLEQLS
jgi:RNA polymerase sigma-70 factor (ECF subfamily)